MIRLPFGNECRLKAVAADDYRPQRMISVDVLGPFALEVGAKTVPVPGRRERCVLGVLAINNGRVVTFTTLEEFLWGEDPPRTARKSLQSAVANIRRVVADENISDRTWLETNEIGYRLSLPVDAVDLARFESLAEAGSSALKQREAPLASQHFAGALALWRGDEPAALGDGTSASAERSRLIERRLEVLADRIAADLASGGSAGLVAELRGLCQKWPRRERFHEYLMLALHRDGRDIEAISVMQELRSRLLESHGLEPGERLQELEVRILDHDPSLLVTVTSNAAQRLRSSASLPRTRALVGRGEELERVGEALRQAPLVTLVGPGGVGKTSLAAEVARREQAGGAEVVWCTLGNVDGAALVPSIATTLGVAPRSGVTMQEGILQRLRAGTTLLVADNCEHLLGAVADLVAELLGGCPGLRVLATSRERLGIEGEQVWPLAGLGVPPLRDLGDPRDSPAVELFIDRAIRSDAFFRLDDAKTAAIVTTCRALDGNPLAIELAAARVRALPPQEIARRLDSRFELLTGRRDEDERHRSLWATVEWSYSLLGAREREVFRRLGTFAGPFTIEAAQAVVAFEGVAASEVPSLLADLVDKSMVASDVEDASPRFRLLETMRVFARVHLAEEGETHIADSALLDYLCDELERLGAAVTGPDEIRAVTSIGQMFDNVRRAVDIARDRGDTSSLACLLNSLSPYLRFRVSWEANSWFTEAVELMAEVDSDTAARGTLVVATAAWGLWLGGDLDAANALISPVLETRPEDDPGFIELLAARSVLEMYLDDEACTTTAIRALELAEVARRDWIASYLLGAVALTFAYRGQPDSAHEYIDRQEAIVSDLGNETARAWWLYCSAEVSGDRDPVRTVALARAAVTAARRTQASLIENTALITAVTVAARHGQATELIDDFAEVIEQCRQQGAWTHLAVMVHNLIEALAALGADEAAVTLLHTDRRGAVTAYGEQAERLDALAAELQSRLPEDTFTRAAQVGRMLTRDEVADTALRAIAQLAPTGPGLTTFMRPPESGG